MRALPWRPVRPAKLLGPLFLLLTALSLTGCVRVHAGLGLTTDDRVAGRIVIAGYGAPDGDPNTQIAVPQDLSDRVSVAPYKADGYNGTQLSFDGLTFDELRELAEADGHHNRFQFNFHRSGGLVALSGSVDLTEIQPSHADVIIKVNFPGQILNTDGHNENGTITWKPRPGQVSLLSATAEYSGVPSVGLVGWMVLVGGFAVTVAVVVGLLALAAHRRNARALGVG
ncbi:DUF3153 domain-containing protein [Gandjariella thermophila]|uniref:LppM domain-containing protein n=1 Tax=Gandjariella thermophila TaxID=1931992 RepID=A0A4D4J757_9PSEU|nr:DUF3153 domain-containing protein [Gandjariella thermophila]GDY30359.1 hypothetical protein GTS_19920 [Gandjariella thermophila]